MLGSGVAATVWAKPNAPFILKLFTDNDKVYLQFLKLIAATPNPHFPVLKGKPAQINDRYWAVQMERLTPLGDDFDTAEYCSYYVSLYKQVADAEKEQYEKSIHKIEPQRSWDLTAQQLAFARQKLAHIEPQFPPDLALALQLIVKHIYIPMGVKPDLHNENVMMRGNTIVITDPGWYHNSEAEFTKSPEPHQYGFPWGKDKTPAPTTTGSPIKIQYPDPYDWDQRRLEF
jgi:hypothetical protein